MPMTLEGTGVCATEVHESFVGVRPLETNEARGRGVVRDEGATAETDHQIAAGVGEAHPEPGLHLPPAFWSASPMLEHIAQAARARLVAPDAVLGSVLVRVAAITPHTVEIPPTVGAPVGLTCLAALVGPPSAGKSAACAVAGELLPAPDRVLDRLPIGSGEGMVEVLFGMVDDESTERKGRQVRRQTRNAAIFHVDEGTVISELGARSGSTLLPTLRTAFTHGTLGNTNASAERRRILLGRDYVYGISLGIQPELAGPLLGDAGAGTPQRFIWLSATDPTMPESSVAFPGPLLWATPGDPLLRSYEVVRGSSVRHEMRLADSIVSEVRARRVAAVRGHASTTPNEAHQTLVRLKVAALLALLEGGLEVGVREWDLAGMVVDVSARVRNSIQAQLAAASRRKETETNERLARRDAHVEATRAARSLQAASRSVGNVVVKHRDEGKHVDLGGGCARSCLTTSIGSKYRQVVTVDDAIEEAVLRGWLEGVGERWVPGPSRPG